MLGTLLTACKKPSTDAAPASNDTTGKSTVSRGKSFEIEARGPAACHVNAECAALVRLKALGGFHINKEYPYRFLAKANSVVRFAGKDPAGPETFSKAAGDFLIDSESEATLSVAFVPNRSGKVTLEGVYKMSVCSDEACEIEQSPITIDVTVL